MQINRLFEIIYILMNKKTATAGELAQRFGVSRRTIYRDVDALSVAGIPVYTEKGKGGGIGLLPDFVLNKSILSGREQDEILSALHGLSSVQAADTARVLEKLSTVFNKNAVRWLEVDFTDWSFSGGDAFSDVKTGILERRIVEFDYFNSYGEKSHRRVEPLLLWFKSRAWYVRGYCLTKQGVRLFKLTRMKRLRLTEEHFSPRELSEGDGDGESPNHPAQPVALRLKVAPEMTYRAYDEFGEDMLQRQADGSLMVEVTYPLDDWVYGFILSFGEYIEVLAPEDFRRAIREKASNIAEKYGGCRKAVGRDALGAPSAGQV